MTAVEIINDISKNDKRSYLAGMHLVEIRMPPYLIEILKAYCNGNYTTTINEPEEDGSYVGNFQGIPVIQKDNITKIQYVVEDKDEIDFQSWQKRLNELEIEHIKQTIVNQNPFERRFISAEDQAIGKEK